MTDFVKDGPWTICKVTVGGRASYELWHDNRPDMVGRADTFSEVRDIWRREQNRQNKTTEND